MSHQRHIYLDHAATTPTDPRVVEAMLPYFSTVYGNPASVHRVGNQAERAIEQARRSIADILNCQPAEIVFTSGGSESDNLAVRGAAWAGQMQHKTHLISTPIEHDAVLNTITQLSQHMGFTHTLLPVNAQGLVNPADVADAITDESAVLSVIYANNEIGSIQPIAEIAAIAHERGVPFHTDAVQAAGQLVLDVQALGVDLLSLAAHKFYGPKGVGLLYVREGTHLLPTQTGGKQEDMRRAGTLNTPLIVGMAKALEIAEAERAARVSRYSHLRDKLISGILECVPTAQLSGHRTQRLPSHASFVLPGVDANKLLMHLDMRRVAASSGSACKVGNPEPSGVLLALGYDANAANGGLRLTLGKDTTEADIDVAIDAVAQSVAALQGLTSPMS